MSLLDCAILTSEAEIAAIADEWRALHARSGQSPFTDYDWFVVWWRIIGRTDGARRLHVVVGEENGRLVGVLPLMVMFYKNLRVLQAAGQKSYYYCDMLCENEAQGATLWEAAKQSPHYDFADIRDVYPESPCHKPLSAFARKRDVLDAFFLRFHWKTGAEWLASLSGNVRGNYKRCTRRLEEKGVLTWHHYENGPVPLTLLDGLVKDKVAWCKARGKTGLFDRPAVFTYFQQIAGHMAKKGQLFFSWLTCGDQVIAYILGFTHQGVLHLPFWTYDAAWAQYSPGNVALVRTVEWAIDNGLKGIDLRQGRSFFKLKYANEMRKCDEFTFSRSAEGRMVEEAFIFARKIKRLIKGDNDAEGGDISTRDFEAAA